jgi:hypothetical protein
MIELVAQRFRVLGEPMRIKLLDRLREGEATVGELQEALGVSQQTSQSTSASFTARAWSPAPSAAPTPATRSATPAYLSSAT